MAASSSSSPSRSRGRRTVLLLWFAQFISLVATDVTKFALRVYTYHQTGSVTQFALITFFAEAPSLLLAPLAGAFVDRYDRKLLMMISDAGCACSTFLVYTVLQYNAMPIALIYAANCVSSVLNAVQWPAFTASISLLVPKESLAKFAGLNQAAQPLSMLLAPAIAGAMVEYDPSMRSVFALEFCSFFVAISVTALSHIPRPPKTAEGQAGAGHLLSEIATAWRFIRQRPGLLGLLFYLAQGHLVSGIVQVLYTPLVLNFASPHVLGNVMTLSGVGGMVGITFVVLWGGPERKIFAVLTVFIIQGALLAVCGSAPNTRLILSVAFSYMLLLPLAKACREAIWLRKTPADMQGRVLALQRMLGQAAVPLAAVIAGPLADVVFEPLLVPNGPLAGSVGAWIGVGKGRGVALLMIVCGLLNVCAGAAGFFIAPLRRVDIDLPDAPHVASNSKASSATTAAPTNNSSKAD